MEHKPSGRDTLVAVALLLVGAVAVAFMPSTAKIAFQAGSNTETVVAIRAFTGTVLLGLYLLWRRGRLAIPAFLVPSTVVVCLSAAGMNYTFYHSVLYIDISLAMLIIFAHPLLVAIYYHFSGNTPLGLLRILCALAAFSGLALALAVDFSTISTTGLVYASVSALFAAAMVVSMVRVSAEVGGVTTNFHISLWTLALFTVILVSVGQVEWPQTTLGWIAGVGNGLAFLTAYLTFLLAAGLIGGSRASMLTFMEPIAAIFLAMVLFGETLGWLQWGGVVMVLAGLTAMEIPAATNGRKTGR